MQGCEKTESPVLYRFKFVKDEASLKWSILSSKLLSGFSWISWRRWLHKDYSSHLTGTMKEFYGCFLAPLDRKHHPVCWAESCLSSSSEGAEANDAEGHLCQGSRVLCLPWVRHLWETLAFRFTIAWRGSGSTSSPSWKGVVAIA